MGMYNAGAGNRFSAPAFSPDSLLHSTYLVT